MAGFVPYFTYRDGHAALNFLEKAFGFERIAAYDDDRGKLAHGEMRSGDAFLMLGSGDEPSNGAPGTYLHVQDLDAHFEKAKAAGATIVWEPHDTEFGTRRYRCKDPEGYEWSFGTYQPGASW